MPDRVERLIDEPAEVELNVAPDRFRWHPHGDLVARVAGVRGRGEPAAEVFVAHCRAQVRRHVLPRIRGIGAGDGHRSVPAAAPLTTTGRRGRSAIGPRARSYARATARSVASS